MNCTCGQKNNNVCAHSATSGEANIDDGGSSEEEGEVEKEEEDMEEEEDTEDLFRPSTSNGTFSSATKKPAAGVAGTKRKHVKQNTQKKYCYCTCEQLYMDMDLHELIKRRKVQWAGEALMLDYHLDCLQRRLMTLESSLRRLEPSNTVQIKFEEVVDFITNESNDHVSVMQRLDRLARRKISTGDQKLLKKALTHRFALKEPTTNGSFLTTTVFIEKLRLLQTTLFQQMTCLRSLDVLNVDSRKKIMKNYSLYMNAKRRRLLRNFDHMDKHYVIAVNMCCGIFEYNAAVKKLVEREQLNQKSGSRQNTSSPVNTSQVPNNTTTNVGGSDSNTASDTKGLGKGCGSSAPRAEQTNEVGTLDEIIEAYIHRVESKSGNDKIDRLLGQCFEKYYSTHWPTENNTETKDEEENTCGVVWSNKISLSDFDFSDDDDDDGDNERKKSDNAPKITCKKCLKIVKVDAVPVDTVSKAADASTETRADRQDRNAKVWSAIGVNDMQIDGTNTCGVVSSQKISLSDFDFSDDDDDDKNNKTVSKNTAVDLGTSVDLGVKIETDCDENLDLDSGDPSAAVLTVAADAIQAAQSAVLVEIAPEAEVTTEVIFCTISDNDYGLDLVENGFTIPEYDHGSSLDQLSSADYEIVDVGPEAVREPETARQEESAPGGEVVSPRVVGEFGDLDVQNTDFSNGADGVVAASFPCCSGDDISSLLGGLMAEDQPMDIDDLEFNIAFGGSDDFLFRSDDNPFDLVRSPPDLGGFDCLMDFNDDGGGTLQQPDAEIQNGWIHNDIFLGATDQVRFGVPQQDVQVDHEPSAGGFEVTADACEFSFDNAGPLWMS